MSTIPNAASRVAAQTRQMQGQQVVCARCGGNYFREEQITTYRAGGQGSVEIQAESDGQIFPILICLCGLPVLPKPAVNRRAGGIYETAQKACREAVAQAIEYLNANSPQAIASNLLGAAAGKQVEDQVEKLDARVANAEEGLRKFAAEHTTLPVDKPAEKKKKDDDTK